MKHRNPNVKLLRRIQKRIKESPEQFEMSAWFRSDITIPECGTAACIAGWAITLSKQLTPLKAALLFDKQFNARGDVVGRHWSGDVQTQAARTLRIDDHAARKLFITAYWPSEFRRRYSAANTPAAEAEVACARIDYFITYGE